VHRLHEVVIHLDADRFAQQRLLLALRHHHHGHRRVDGADLRQQLQPALARHLLVEQHEAVRLAAQQRERIVAVRGLLDGEPLLLEELAVGGEPLHLVVDPQDGLGVGADRRARRSWRGGGRGGHRGEN